MADPCEEFKNRAAESQGIVDGLKLDIQEATVDQKHALAKELGEAQKQLARDKRSTTA